MPTWLILTTTLGSALLALAAHELTRRHQRLKQANQHRWDTMRYRATTARWGIGPVSDTGTWRHWHTAIGISIVIAGHGYALFRWPKEAVASGDRSGPNSRA